MKELDIHIDKTFSMASETDDIGLGVHLSILFDNILDEEISKDFEKIRNNGGKILFATTSIEKKMECLLRGSLWALWALFRVQASEEPYSKMKSSGRQRSASSSENYQPLLFKE